MGQIKKTRLFLGDLTIWTKMHLSLQIRDPMRTQEPSSKFGLLPRGLINSVCSSTFILPSLLPSLSPRKGASGAVLRFAWFGEEPRLKSSSVWVWGPRSQIQRTKNNGFSTNSTTNTPDLKTSTGYGRRRASYLGNLLSELRSDQT